MDDENDYELDEETENSPVSPDQLLDIALGEIPGAELLPYLSTIMFLREHRKYSWRGISKWLSDKGNIKLSHTTVSEFYQAVGGSAAYQNDWRDAEDDLHKRMEVMRPL